MARAMTERHVIELINRYGGMESEFDEAVRLAAGNYNVRGIANPIRGVPTCTTSELFSNPYFDETFEWHLGQCSDFFKDDFKYQTEEKSSGEKILKELKIYNNSVIVPEGKNKLPQFIVGAAFSGQVNPRLYDGPSHYVISGKVTKRKDGRKMVCFMTEGWVSINTSDGILGYIGAVNDYNKCLHYLPSTVPEKELLGDDYDFPFMNEREPSWLSLKVRTTVDELKKVQEGQAVGVAWRSPDRPEEPVISPSRLLTYYIPEVEGTLKIGFIFCLEQRVIMDTYAIPETRGVVTIKNEDGTPKSYRIGASN